MKLPAVVERFTALGLDSVGSTPAEFARFIKADMDVWTKLTRELNLDAAIAETGCRFDARSAKDGFRITSARAGPE